MWLLALGSGMVVGLSLGLTGGGGALFAVPLLVYGLAVPPREAVGISLASVGATSAVGFVGQWLHGEVEIRTGLMFALAGMVGAPAGSWLATQVADGVLLSLFALLMAVVAVLVWRKSARKAGASESGAAPATASACRHNAAGRLAFDSRCATVLLTTGVGTGVLTGLFGVGGGFVIVPALVLLSHMSIRRAVGTSMLVITLVSAVGLAARFWAGETLRPVMLSFFTVGGIAGVQVGSGLGRRLPEQVLQRVFALAILGVAALMLAKNFAR